MYLTWTIWLLGLLACLSIAGGLFFYFIQQGMKKEELEELNK